MSAPQATRQLHALARARRMIARRNSMQAAAVVVLYLLATYGAFVLAIRLA